MTPARFPILPFVIAISILWSICWILILARAVRLKTYVQPALTLGNILGMELVVALFYLHTIPQTAFFYISFLLWPAISLANLALMFLYWERKLIPYLLVWIAISAAGYFWILETFNDAGTFTISASLTALFVSLGHLYQLRRDGDLRRHSWAIWGTRFVAATADSILIFNFYPYGQTVFIICVRSLVFVMDVVYAGLFWKKNRGVIP